ncbi:MAG: biotin transporter BioY [Opitutales bacterium]|nr:biotin transporter BioY [Opitutales bacterium]
MDYIIRTLPSTANLRKSLGICVFGSLLLAICSQIQIPLWPVPMTLQTAAVLFLAYRFGSTHAVRAVLAWVLVGSFNLPVFSHLTGIGALSGPSAGYIYGMVLQAYSARWFFKSGLSIPRLIAGGYLCVALTFIVGYAWLSGFVGTNMAFTTGVAPFLLSESLKIIVTSWFCNQNSSRCVHTI